MKTNPENVILKWENYEQMKGIVDASKRLMEAFIREDNLDVAPPWAPVDWTNYGPGNWIKRTLKIDLDKLLTELGHIDELAKIILGQMYYDEVVIQTRYHATKCLVEAKEGK